MANRMVVTLSSGDAETARVIQRRLKLHRTVDVIRRALVLYGLYAELNEDEELAILNRRTRDIDRVRLPWMREERAE